MQKIKIEGIEQKTVQFGNQVTIKSGDKKYSFFDSKRDGGKTKAWEQFSKFGFRVGDEVEAQVNEEEKTFRNAQGKNINFTQRTILFFAEVENTPMVTRTGVNEVTREMKIGGDLEARIKKLEDVVFAEIEAVEDDNTVLADLKAEEGIKAEDIPFK